MVGDIPGLNQGVRVGKFQLDRSRLPYYDANFGIPHFRRWLIAYKGYLLYSFDVGD